MHSVEEYLTHVPDHQRPHLEHFRDLVKSTIKDDLTEVITYGMPGFKYKGKYLIAYAPFKHHMSIFPGGEAQKFKDIIPDNVMAKGTIQFTEDKLIPDHILRDIILDCQARIDT